MAEPETVTEVPGLDRRTAPVAVESPEVGMTVNCVVALK
jgi:hypothetical protein